MEPQDATALGLGILLALAIAACFCYVGYARKRQAEKAAAMARAKARARAQAKAARKAKRELQRRIAAGKEPMIPLCEAKRREAMLRRKMEALAEERYEDGRFEGEAAGYAKGISRSYF